MNLLAYHIPVLRTELLGVGTVVKEITLKKGMKIKNFIYRTVNISTLLILTTAWR